MSEPEITVAPSDEEVAQATAKRSDRALDHIAELWVEMAATDAYQQLTLALAQEAEKYRRLRFESIMRGDEVNQREVDYERGLIAGLHRPAVMIATARKRLEKSEEALSEPETTEQERSLW